MPASTPPEPRGAGTGAPAAPPAVEHEPIDAVALAEEEVVLLDRLEHLLESLLARLRRYRARRGNWWERG